MVPVATWAAPHVRARRRKRLRRWCVEFLRRTRLLGPLTTILATVTAELPSEDGLPGTELDQSTGRIHADLTTGADVTGAEKLEASANLSSFGVMVSALPDIVALVKESPAIVSRTRN